MLCNFCSVARLDNDAPCPNCSAPSPMRGRTNGTFGVGGTNGTMNVAMPGMAGTTQRADWQPIAQPMPQSMPMNNAEMAFLPQTPQVAEQRQQPFPSQPLQPFQASPTLPSSPPSLLPVLYQGGAANQQDPMGYGGALIPMQDIEAGMMLSSLPLNEGATFVPPMYTKPRPIIPRYRAISGLLSLLIVTLLACGTVGYYAKSSSQFAFLRQLYGATLPANEQPAPTPVLPNPQKAPDYGPAATIITSATTNTRIDPQTYVSVQPSQYFQTGQKIYLTYSIQPPKNSTGNLIIKWYTNNTLYWTSPPKVVTGDPKIVGYVLNGYATQEFSQPTEGKVELDWNNQMGITLFFVVR